MSNKQYLYYAPYFDSLIIQFNYTYIPRHLEECLIFHSGYGISPEMPRSELSNMEFGGLKISEKNLDRYDRFLIDLNKFQIGQVSREKLEERYGDTYWFHVLFIELKPIEIRGQPDYDIS